MTLIDVVDLSSDDELEELDVKAVKLEPDSIGSMTQQKTNSKVQLAKNQISKIVSTRQDYQENRSLNASSIAHSSSCVLDQVQSTMDDANLSSTLFASPAPLCRHFWKAGNYDDRLASKVAHQSIPLSTIEFFFDEMRYLQIITERINLTSAFQTLESFPLCLINFKFFSFNPLC